jgi:hypothetical protein
MGVDLETDTPPIPDLVPHLLTTEVPSYSVEIQVGADLEDEDDGWEHYEDVPADMLPSVVDAMHGSYLAPIRLVENGHPVFTVWR